MKKIFDFKIIIFYALLSLFFNAKAEMQSLASSEIHRIPNTSNVLLIAGGTFVIMDINVHTNGKNVATGILDIEEKRSINPSVLLSPDGTIFSYIYYRAKGENCTIVIRSTKTGKLIASKNINAVKGVSGKNCNIHYTLSNNWLAVFLDGINERKTTLLSTQDLSYIDSKEIKGSWGLQSDVDGFYLWVISSIGDWSKFSIVNRRIKLNHHAVFYSGQWSSSKVTKLVEPDLLIILDDYSGVRVRGYKNLSEVTYLHNDHTWEYKSSIGGDCDNLIYHKNKSIIAFTCESNTFEDSYRIIILDSKTGRVVGMHEYAKKIYDEVKANVDFHKLEDLFKIPSIAFTPSGEHILVRNTLIPEHIGFMVTKTEGTSDIMLLNESTKFVFESTKAEVIK